VRSQRAKIEDQSQTDSFSIERKTAPNAFIAANIGGCQLIESNIKENLDIAIDSIQADALIIHLNPLQELMQPEGDRKFAGIL
jgi:isopentenyl-diphosphate delta-isomerase